MNNPKNKLYHCPVILESAIVHEDTHLEEYRYKAPHICPPSGFYALGFDNAGEAQRSEITAFEKQRVFLEDHLKQPVCLSDQCDWEIRFILDWIDKTAIPSVLNGSYANNIMSD